jgi:SAM-dependent methyltransferase
VLHLLRERVGPRGQVVGVDRDRALLDYAAKLATTRGIGIELVEADATDMSSIATDSFDLVHERTVLLNVTQPAEVIAEMTRVARPGGIVAIQEPDAAAWVCDPPHRAWDLLRDALVGAYAESGKQFNAGRTVARWLRDAGLTDVQVRVTARATAPGEYYHTFLLALCGLVRGQIIELGRMTPADFDGTIAELADHLAGPGTITCQPTMWQAWGRKPLA